MTRKKQAAEPGYNIFVCQLCPDHPQFDMPGTFPAHMIEVHQYDMTAKYHKAMLAHLDAETWFQSDYEWKNGDVVFAVQSTRLPRSPEDQAYWSAE